MARGKLQLLSNANAHPVAIAFAALVASTAMLIGASVAGAVPVTIEFDADTGYYDPTHPGGGQHGPYDWIENGARYSGWWLNNVGTLAGGSEIGHTHLVGENDSVYPLVGDLQHSWRNDLQGTTVSMLNGASFDVVSIDIRIMSRDTPPFDPYNMQRLPWSFDVTNANLLLTNGEPNPVAPDLATFESQFSVFDIDDGSIWDNGDGTFDPNRPGDELFHTINITGFDNVTEFSLSHSAGLVWIGNIVLDVHDGGTPIPEPGTALLLGLGLVGLARKKGARA